MLYWIFGMVLNVHLHKVDDSSSTMYYVRGKNSFGQWTLHNPCELLWSILIVYTKLCGMDDQSGLSLSLSLVFCHLHFPQAACNWVCSTCFCRNPRHADIFASASGDCTVRIWDVRQPRSTYQIPGHEMEILSCDWNKYNEFMLVSGSVDKSIKLWDVRNPRQELTRLLGHTYAVRPVKFSPHQESLLLSCSYDMTVCLWDYRAPEDALLARLAHHTEFAVGIDMSTLVEGLLASTAWDETVFVWQQGMDPRAA